MKYNTANNSQRVFSTDAGRVAEKSISTLIINDDNKLITLKRETKKRGGKTVVVIQGCPTSIQAKTFKKLKGLCACGGAIKDDVIEIQGDHREKIKAYFEQQQFTVKLSGG